jgi:hypothetical protein
VREGVIYYIYKIIYRVYIVGMTGMTSRLLFMLICGVIQSHQWLGRLERVREHISLLDVMVHLEAYGGLEDTLSH